MCRSRRGNDLVGLVYSVLMIGLSFGWWTGKHNRHHAYPNQEDMDPVLSWPPALAFLAVQQGLFGLYPGCASRLSTTCSRPCPGRPCAAAASWPGRSSPRPGCCTATRAWSASALRCWVIFMRPGGERWHRACRRPAPRRRRAWCRPRGAAEDQPAQGRIHVRALTRGSGQPGQPVVQAQRGQPGAHPQDQGQVVHGHHRGVHRQLRADRPCERKLSARLSR
ncbi:MAG: fatty acid desaturase [Streptosporangiaceae bacterium]